MKKVTLKRYFDVTDVNFVEVCEPLLWRKIQVVRLSVQLAKITGLSGMICGL